MRLRNANDKGAYAEFAHILSGHAGNRSWNRFGFDAQQTAEASRLETKGKTPKNCPNLKTPVQSYHCIQILLIRIRQEPNPFGWSGSGLELSRS
jgi:hypothetical protein